jgi:hypothetical protein
LDNAPFGCPGNTAQVRGVDAHNSLYILYVGVDLASHVTSHADGLAIEWNIRPTLHYDIQVKFTCISCTSCRLDTFIEFISNAYPARQIAQTMVYTHFVPQYLHDAISFNPLKGANGGKSVHILAAFYGF